MTLTETQVENDKRVELAGFRPVSQFKRNTMRVGGVAIYEKEESSSTLQSTEEMQIKRITTSHEGVGDICAIETTINDKRALLVSIYMTPGTNASNLCDFFELSLLAYSPKVADIINIVKKRGYHTIPIILCGDLNVDLKSVGGAELIEFMRDTFNLELSNDPAISTTGNNTCINAIFTRNVEHLHTTNYISYSSYHKPLLSITDGAQNCK